MTLLIIDLLILLQDELQNLSFHPARSLKLSCRKLHVWKIVVLYMIQMYLPIGKFSSKEQIVSTCFLKFGSSAVCEKQSNRKQWLFHHVEIMNV